MQESIFYHKFRGIKIRSNNFKTILKESSDLITIINKKAEFLFIDENVRLIFNMSAKNYLGESAFDLMYEEDKQNVLRQFKTLKNKRRIKLDPFRYLSPNGEWRWISATAINLLDDPGVKGILINSRDVTDDKNNLSLLQQQNEQLKEIAWIQCHHLRKPVCQILGLIELIEAEAEQNFKPDNQEIINKLRISANELDNAIKNIIRRAEENYKKVKRA